MKPSSCGFVSRVVFGALACGRKNILDLFWVWSPAYQSNQRISSFHHTVLRKFSVVFCLFRCFCFVLFCFWCPPKTKGLTTHVLFSWKPHNLLETETAKHMVSSNSNICWVPFLFWGLPSKLDMPPSFQSLVKAKIKLLWREMVWQGTQEKCLFQRG